MNMLFMNLLIEKAVEEKERRRNEQKKCDADCTGKTTPQTKNNI